MIGFLLAVLLAAAAPKAEVRNVHIYAPKLTVSRVHAGDNAVVGGQFRVDMSFAKATAKRPVLRLVCLCEVDGALSVQTIFLDRPSTCSGLKRSDITAAYKNAGVEVPSKERELYCLDPSMFTACLPEVGKTAYTSAVYGEKSENRGFFRLGRAAAIPKVLLVRVELWQNGVQVAKYESSHTGLGSYDIPVDWHVYRKYPQKFKYADIR